MNNSVPQTRVPSLVASILLVGGIFLIGLTLISGGTVAALLRHFQHGGSDLALLFERRGVPALRLAGSGLLAAGAACHWWRAQLNHLAARGAAWIDGLDARHGLGGTRANSRSYLAAWLAICAAAVVLPSIGVLAHGYFQFDDFEVMEIARTHSLWNSIFLIHGDHTMPLFRLELGITRMLFGTQALYYNLLLLGLFIAILFTGVLLLWACGAGAIALAAFVILMAGSILWSEFLGGYYMISTYPQQLLLCFLACWAFARWDIRRVAGFRDIFAAALLAAPMLDLSGFWVLPAVLIFVICHQAGAGADFGKQWLRQYRWLILAFAATTLAGLSFVAYVFTFVSPGAFLYMGRASHPSLPQMLAQSWYFVTAGVFLSPLFPVGYWKLPAPAVIAGMLFLSAGALLTAVHVWRKFPSRLRWTMLAALLIILINAVLVARGRPQAGFDYRWPAKYIGGSYAWYAVMLGLALHVVWRRAQAHRKAMMLQMGALAAVIFIAIQTASGFAAGGFSNGAFGMHSVLADADLRRRGVGDMRAAIGPLLAANPGAAIPLLTGKSIEAHDFSLFQYDMNCYGDFLAPAGSGLHLVMNQSMQFDSLEKRDNCQASPSGRDAVTLVPSLRAATDPSFLESLRSNPAARELYLSGMRLDARDVSCTAPDRPSNESSLTPGDGNWDPETRHVLNIAARYDGPEPVGRLLLTFAGDLNGDNRFNWIDVPSGTRRCVAVDLLQIYSYALSNRVHDLTVAAGTAGTWRLQQAEFAQ